MSYIFLCCFFERSSVESVQTSFLFLRSQGAALKPALFLQKERQKLQKGYFESLYRVQGWQSLPGVVWCLRPHKNIFAQTLHRSLWKKVTPKTFNM